MSLDRRHEPAEGVPVERHDVGQDRLGDLLDRRHQPAGEAAIVGVERGQAEAAVAHDHGRASVPTGRRGRLVPVQLALEVGVAVDEAGRHDEAAGVDDLSGRLVDGVVDDSDPAADDPDVSQSSRSASAVDDRATTDQQIEPHCRGLPPRSQ